MHTNFPLNTTTIPFPYTYVYYIYDMDHTSVYV